MAAWEIPERCVANGNPRFAHIVDGVRAMLLAAAVVLAACSGPLAGTELGSEVAPDFTLQDALTGSSVSLASLRGGVVALTFLYTQCPDTCPLTAELLRAAREKLGGDARRVTIIAVSTDPGRDTPQSVRAFSEAHRLSANWHYLIGRPEQLAAVWRLYGVRAAPDQGASTVTHTDAIFLIDKQGRERTVIHTNDAPDAVTMSFRTLLGER